MSDTVPRLYAGWIVERWDTPVSDARSLRLVSLVDDGALRLTLEDGLDPARRRWRPALQPTAGPQVIVARNHIVCTSTPHSPRNKG